MSIELMEDITLLKGLVEYENNRPEVVTKDVWAAELVYSHQVLRSCHTLLVQDIVKGHIGRLVKRLVE